ncbi:hypothetical protein DMH17_10860 [Raoultella planticola]|nr:hypothetical protein [Raoultella planticola]
MNFDFLNPLAVSHFSRQKDRIRVPVSDPATGGQLTAPFDWAVSLGKKADNRGIFEKHRSVDGVRVLPDHDDEISPMLPAVTL